MRRTTILLAAASATFLALAACGSSSTSATVTSTTVTSTTGTGTVPRNVVPTGEHAAEPFCQDQYLINNGPSPFDDTSSTAADFEKYLNDVFVPTIAKLRADAPPALAADVEKVASGSEKLLVIMKAHSYDPKSSFVDPELQQLINDASFLSANDAVNAYCGFGS